jgi:hypothetical protein
LHGVVINSKDQQALSKKFSTGGNINYKDALAELQIDLDHASLG